eukprot:TRINITY_DN70795_c0_g1_i1.p1 TRINITY_DN70795_c0_g1~~TRINITY_DN70795_c0_g1_i1.p1  ORF type:complete len:169 (-),score=36.21 TRINITY_DN70795_c0_g1_i1:9-455(-)
MERRRRSLGAALLLLAAVLYGIDIAEPLFATGAARVLDAGNAAGSQGRKSVVACRATKAKKAAAVEEDDEEIVINFRKRNKRDPNWKPPFPKFIVTFGALLGLLGFIGGGPQLAQVWGLMGVGLGVLFEPFQRKDGTIVGVFGDTEDE